MRSLIALFVALAVITYASAQDKNEVHEVLQILTDLKNNQEKELLDLDEAQKERESRKKSIVESLSASAQQQRLECSSRADDVTNKQSDIEKTKNFIQYMVARQSVNQKRTDVLESNRCDRNNNHINDMKNDKVSLALIQFLRKEHENLKKDPSLINSWAQKVQKFVAVYKTGRQYSMVQLRQENNRADVVQLLSVGMPTGEVKPLSQLDEMPFFEYESVPSSSSEDEEEMTFVSHMGTTDKQYPPQEEQPLTTDQQIQPSTEVEQDTQVVQDTIQSLLNLLDDLEKKVRHHLEFSQDNQINSALSFADFSHQLDRENTVYEIHIHEEKDQLVRLENHLTTRTQASALCVVRLNQITVAYKISEQDLDDSKKIFDETRASKVEELTVFGDVYRIYVNQVANA